MRGSDRRVHHGVSRPARWSISLVAGLLGRTAAPSCTSWCFKTRKMVDFVGCWVAWTDGCTVVYITVLQDPQDGRFRWLLVCLDGLLHRRVHHGASRPARWSISYVAGLLGRTAAPSCTSRCFKTRKMVDFVDTTA